MKAVLSRKNWISNIIFGSNSVEFEDRLLLSSTLFISVFMLFSIISLFAVAVAPTVTLSPLDGAINVTHNGTAKTVRLTMTFDQAILPGADGAGAGQLTDASGPARPRLPVVPAAGRHSETPTVHEAAGQRPARPTGLRSGFC